MPIGTVATFADDDADHLDVSVLGATPVAVGDPLTIRLEARDAQDGLVPYYAKGVVLGAVGGADPVATAPGQLSLVAGVFEGPITLASADTNIVLQVSDPLGPTDVSMPWTRSRPTAMGSWRNSGNPHRATLGLD